MGNGRLEVAQTGAAIGGGWARLARCPDVPARLGQPIGTVTHRLALRALEARPDELRFCLKDTTLRVLRGGYVPVSPEGVGEDRVDAFLRFAGLEECSHQIRRFEGPLVDGRHDSSHPRIGVVRGRRDVDLQGGIPHILLSVVGPSVVGPPRECALRPVDHLALRVRAQFVARQDHAPLPDLSIPVVHPEARPRSGEGTVVRVPATQRVSRVVTELRTHPQLDLQLATRVELHVLSRDREQIVWDTTVLVQREVARAACVDSPLRDLPGHRPADGVSLDITLDAIAGVGECGGDLLDTRGCGWLRLKMALPVFAVEVLRQEAHAQSRSSPGNLDRHPTESPAVAVAVSTGRRQGAGLQDLILIVHHRNHVAGHVVDFEAADPMFRVLVIVLVHGHTYDDIRHARVYESRDRPTARIPEPLMPVVGIVVVGLVENRAVFVQDRDINVGLSPHSPVLSHLLNPYQELEQAIRETALNLVVPTRRSPRERAGLRERSDDIRLEARPPRLGRHARSLSGTWQKWWGAGKR